MAAARERERERERENVCVGFAAAVVSNTSCAYFTVYSALTRPRQRRKDLLMAAKGTNIQLLYCYLIYF